VIKVKYCVNKARVLRIQYTLCLISLRNLRQGFLTRQQTCKDVNWIILML
jgi:hypothetical protein